MSNVNHNIRFVYHLVKSLSKPELRLLKLHLGGSRSKQDTTSTDGDIKSGKTLFASFIDKIVAYKGDDDIQQIEDYLSKFYNTNQRRNVSSRILKRIDDFLLMELTIVKGANKDRVVQQFLLRRIVILDVLLSKGLFDHFRFISQKLILLADRYEKYLEAMTIIRMQMAFLVNRINQREYNNLVEAHNLRFHKYQEVFKCNNYAIRLQQMYNERFKFQNIKEFLNPIIERLNEQEIDSDTWRIGRNLILLEYYQQNEDFENGDLVCQNTISIYNRNKYISNPTRIGNAYRQFANNQMLGGKYKLSIVSIEKILNVYPKGSINWISCYEHIFLAYFYLNQFDMAFSTLKLLNSASQKSINLSMRSRLDFYNGVLEFKFREYNNALSKFYNAGNLYEDKGGWGFCIRLYTLLAYIEMNDLDSATISYDSFRKYFDKYNKLNEIPERFVLIFSIIRRIVKSDFNILRASSDLASLVSELNYSGMKWQPKSPELVKFDDWLKKIF